MRTNPSSLRIATYNLRYASQPDQITVSESISALGNPLAQDTFLALSGEQPWSTRRLHVAEHLLSEVIVIAGIQEALKNDLAQLFRDDWGCIGVGRSDEVEGGEYCPLFYKKSAVKQLSNDTFWLSRVHRRLLVTPGSYFTDTPFKPSKYPGASTFRLCTAASFSLTMGAKTKFTVLNTHLDNRSDKQRRLGASLLLARARYEAVHSHSPVFVIGDFNSLSTGESSGAYDIITGASAPVSIDAPFTAKYNVGNQLPDFKMVDLRSEAPRKRVSNNFATYTGFNKPSDTSVWKRVDFVFGGCNFGWTSEAYKVGSSLSVMELWRAINTRVCRCSHLNGSCGDTIPSYAVPCGSEGYNVRI
ncbi:Endonuclease/exonuclease/phosphatase [Armillaria borealis]|uniref:Endonuclease/exonuclease/phosphatase n=1 Tax=Armillaria borealis TaxID=47425 RepID=A0AA39MCC7_9AGAR|nr:Endonuclease/exonuclease/phosphatase [Armillaria borealis]